MMLVRNDSTLHLSHNATRIRCRVDRVPCHIGATTSQSSPTTPAPSSYSLETTFAGQLPSVAFDANGIVEYTAPPNLPRAQAPEKARPIVILPGFGNKTNDYVAPFGKEDSLVNSLKARGFPAYVVQVDRKDWFRIAQALLTIRFWKSTLTTSPGYTWYLKRVHEAVEAALQETGADQVDLVGHSAGGWLGRAFLADPEFFPPESSQQQSSQASSTPAGRDGLLGDGSITGKPRPNPRVRSLITLGTPQKPPPSGTVRDVTGGAVGWVHNSYPGAFFADQGVSYVNVCGMTVQGRREVDSQGKLVYDTKRPRFPYEYAYDSYNQVCAEGQGTVGDAVVPLKSAFLHNARQLVIPGVWHSMSKVGTFDEESGVVWYGSDTVVDTWLQAYIEEAYGKVSI